jgi:hypothetical protein
MRRPSASLLLAFAVAAPTHLALAQKSSSPDEKLWNELKAGLQAENSDDFFEHNLKDSLAPSGAKSVHAFKGTVISSRPAEHPREVVVAISDSTHPEVTLRFTDQQGKEDHLKKPINPGSRIAFSGVVTAYSKDPFMLTFEVEGEDGSSPTFAVVVPSESSEQAITMPAVSVNDPYSLTLRFVNISLDGLPQYRVRITDHGVTTEMIGVRLERFLLTAGWSRHLSNDHLHYAAEIDGVQSVTTLDMVDLGSFDKQAWLVVTGTPEASLIVADAAGTQIQKVEGVERVRVSEKP